MALVLEHCGKTINRQQKKQTIKETYVGLESQVNSKISTLTFGVYQQGSGFLESWEKEQRGGKLYAVNITYGLSYTMNGSPDTGDDLTQIERSTLDCTILSLPLEANPNYCTKWQYYLIGLGGYALVQPQWWETAKDTFINPTTEDFQHYKWIKNLSEMPTEPSSSGQYWQVVKNVAVVDAPECKPTKMGVESWDYNTYTINEVREFGNRGAAGSAASKKLNKIVSQPDHGDFGVTPSGCDWKVDSSTVQFDGNKWVVSTTYTMSGPGGWDKDLYEVYESEE